MIPAEDRRRRNPVIGIILGVVLGLLRVLFVPPGHNVAHQSKASITMQPTQDEARAAWCRIEALGGHGVWDDDMVVVLFDGTAVEDADLDLFDHFPHAQILNLSRTRFSDAGLDRLIRIPALEELILVDTQVSPGGIERFREARPDVKITTQSAPKGQINPFTGQSF